MKKMLWTAALAALALFGCQKHTEVLAGGLEFTSAAPATRTGWTGETIEWTAGDAISMAYTVDGSWVGPNLYASTPLTAGGPTARFKVPGNFPTDLTGSHHFYAVYPAVSQTDFSDAPDVTVTVPSIQTPTATSYDPAADLMAGTSTDDWRSFPTSAVPLRWTRLTAHADITLKNLALSDGETVQSIVLQGQNGAELTGDAVVDIVSPEDYATDGSPRVTVLADNLSVDASGNLRFWVSIYPVTLTDLTVTVVTDQATYRKTFSGISKKFTQNARNMLRISMQGATKTTPEPEPQYYVKVTSAPTDWTGDYLIVYEEGSLAFNGALTKLDDAHNTISVSILDSKISRSTTTDASRFTITRSGNGYAILAASGLYIGQGSNSNGLASSESELVNTISYNASDQSVDIISSGGAYLRFNAADNQVRFRYYKSSTYSAQNPIQLYKLDGTASGGGSGTDPTPVEPTVTTGAASNVTQSEVTLSATYTGTPTYAGVELGLSADALSEDWQASYVNGGVFNVTVDGLGAGHTYYYRAYIAVLEGKDYVYYYGEVRSFTTPASEIVIDGGQPGWYETPRMDITHSGDYMFNTSDPTQYYAVHMCTGGEKGPDGKTARNYTVCFSAEHHCPLWVAAPRHNMYVGSAGRNESYRADPDIPADIQYLKNAIGGGCNRGHMLGSAERTSSKATNRDVFYFTNIAPQLSANFNTGGGRWNVLEDFVDKQVCADTLYEVLGCYFDQYTDAYGETQEPTRISYGGRTDVSMPTMFYYVLIRTKNGNTGKALKDCTASELKCVAFVRSHVNVRQAVTSRELMSVADLERITGVTYFPNVPNAPKTSFSASDWGL